MASDFSRSLALLRQERGLSQRTAAKDLGISQALLSHYENGIREPGLAFVVKACDYYRVSADFLLGRTLARDGSMLTADEIIGAADESKVLSGSVLATLQSKLITGSVSVLFGLLGRLGDKTAINAAAACLGDGVYRLYRRLHHVSGGTENYFSLPDGVFGAGAADAVEKLAEAEYAEALRAQAEQKAVFPNLRPEKLAADYPGRSQAFTQVISAADARSAHLMERK